MLLFFFIAWLHFRAGPMGLGALVEMCSRKKEEKKKKKRREKRKKNPEFKSGSSQRFKLEVRLQVRLRLRVQVRVWVRLRVGFFY